MHKRKVGGVLCCVWIFTFLRFLCWRTSTVVDCNSLYNGVSKIISCNNFQLLLLSNGLVLHKLYYVFINYCTQWKGCIVCLCSCVSNWPGNKKEMVTNIWIICKSNILSWSFSKDISNYCYWGWKGDYYYNNNNIMINMILSLLSHWLIAL